MMSKQGTAFHRLIEADARQPAVWDPHRYRGAGGGALGDYVEVRGLRRVNGAPPSPFRAIEYGDIGRGDHLTFTLEAKPAERAAKPCAIGEQALLMGTMRAYLGNVIVTPRAAWVGRARPLAFSVKSEFAQILPRDGLVYFWWAYLRSAAFLAGLPAGSGGTRPRLQPDALTATSVNVPGLEKRTAIHKQLAECAAREWRETLRRRAIIEAARLAVD